ncbi:MAG TPA: hypothetical protein VLT36_24455, partial [Candidatus Dormibacteraeota bacterium]|nr:hypothetical protein [Candidatus Dormibacteraeota bacterium]
VLPERDRRRGETQEACPKPNGNSRRFLRLAFIDFSPEHATYDHITVQQRFTPRPDQHYENNMPEDVSSRQLLAIPYEEPAPQKQKYRRPHQVQSIHTSRILRAG